MTSLSLVFNSMTPFVCKIILTFKRLGWRCVDIHKIRVREWTHGFIYFTLRRTLIGCQCYSLKLKDKKTLHTYVVYVAMTNLWLMLTCYLVIRFAYVYNQLWFSHIVPHVMFMCQAMTWNSLILLHVAMTFGILILLGHAFKVASTLAVLALSPVF